MNFIGTIRRVDSIQPAFLSDLKALIDLEFGEKWVRRTLNLMPDSYCLKAITPSPIDILEPQDSARLREILLPIVSPFLKDSQELIYLDINNLPAGAECLPHIDHALMHVLSMRIHIPITTNPDAKFVVRNLEGNHNYHLNVGGVYEVNNQILHAVGNYGETDRWHIIADVIHKPLYEYLKSVGRLFATGVNGSINFSYDPQILSQLRADLRGPAVEI